MLREREDVADAAEVQTIGVVGTGTEIWGKLGTRLGGGMFGEVGGTCRLSGGIPGVKTVFEEGPADWWS